MPEDCGIIFLFRDDCTGLRGAVQIISMTVQCCIAGRFLRCFRNNHYMRAYNYSASHYIMPLMGSAASSSFRLSLISS